MSAIAKIYQTSSIARAILFPVVAVRRSLGIDSTTRQKLKDQDQDVIILNLKNLLIGDPVLNLKDFNGHFRMGSDGHLFGRIVREGSYEPKIAALADHFVQKDRDVLDVGANIGFFSVKFAKLIQGGRVLAVEPTTNALRRLKINLLENSVSEKVIIFEGVAAAREGQEKITFIEGKEEYSTLGTLAHPSVSGEARCTKEVEAITLNSLVKTHQLNPGFMKVDVEGAEHLVFAGAAEVLRNHRPIILTELCEPLLKKNGSSAEAVMAMIRAESYEIFDAECPDREAGSDHYGNVICFPKESGLTKDSLKTALNRCSP